MHSRFILGLGCRVGLGLVCLVACSSKAESVEHYNTRGLVVAVARDAGETVVTLHHEAIPAFKDRDGKAANMASMKMNFSLGTTPAPDVQAGDKLAIDFDVHWSGGPPLRITRHQKLPPETALVLSDEH